MAAVARGDKDHQRVVWPWGGRSTQGARRPLPPFSCQDGGTRCSPDDIREPGDRQLEFAARGTRVSSQQFPAVPAPTANEAVPDDAKSAWYAVQVKRFCERRVARYLSMKSVRVFLPLIECVRRHQETRRLTRLEPLFPGYLLVRLSDADVHAGGWHAVRWTPGVRRILGTDDVPSPMPDQTVQAIELRVKDLGFVRPGSRFVEGNRVRMRRGVFAGLEAIFDGPMSRAGRVRVLLDLLGQARRAEVDELDLESA